MPSTMSKSSKSAKCSNIDIGFSRELQEFFFSSTAQAKRIVKVKSFAMQVEELLNLPAALIFDIAALGLYGMVHWIWNYFEQKEVKITEDIENTEKDSKNKRKVTVIICQYKETLTFLSYGTTYVRKDSSTSNAIAHLCSKYNITKLDNPNNLSMHPMTKKMQQIHTEN
ncbi:hypothetical protein C1645_837987 [Glomus cerebriforme]|uniref:Uncharacterized protein n=1 Tax=Glomus cerebriforme TaxID=658196 RepID=A0A397SDL1_9GLOM|nr:hypothetical protein C1645_837987 [Glomus cerebriforme]